MTHPFHREVPLINQYFGSFIFFWQCAFPQSDFLEKLRKLNVQNTVKKINQKIARKEFEPGRILQVDRIKDLPAEQFKRNYLDQNMPVVIDNGAGDWDCTKKWNIDYLEKYLGDEKIIFLDTVGLTEKDMDQSNSKTDAVVTDTMSAKEFAQALKNGSKKYLRFSLFMESRKDFQKDLNHKWLEERRNGFFRPGYQTFIGPKDRTTPIHAASSAFFYIMADGEKKWTFFSANSTVLINNIPSGRNYNMSDVNINNPDLNLYPGFNLLTRYECYLKKGDILFVPGYMWHEVENHTISWACNYRFNSLDEVFRYPTFILTRIFFSKPSVLTSFLQKFILKQKSMAKVE